MRLWQISDLHLTKEQLNEKIDLGQVPKADVALIVGDVSDNVFDSLAWCSEYVRPHMAVIYIPGNHDFYYTEMASTSARARRAARKLGIHYLDGDTMVLDGVRFAGASFWSDFELDAMVDGKPCPDLVAKNIKAARGQTDYKRIYRNYRSAQLLKPHDTQALHYEHRKYLDRTLSRKFDGPTVVATHFAVHERSILPKYRHVPNTAAYLSDQTDLIERHQPALWLHGHVHNHSEYKVGDTRIACNPKGYDAEKETGFRWDYTHEI